MMYCFYFFLNPSVRYGKGEAAIVAMAVRYGQGAIYAYEPIPGEAEGMID